MATDSEFLVIALLKINEAPAALGVKNGRERSGSLECSTLLVNSINYLIYIKKK
jgi:hypothetical protein